MGTMIFQLPSELPQGVQGDLERASIAGGQDCMPYPTHVLVDGNQMILSRQVDESGSLMVPWQINGAGQLMVSSATLMERLAPYQLALELARGKVNQLRGQTSDWLMGGLLMPESLAEEIRRMTLTFSRAVTHVPDPQAEVEALQALSLGFQAAHHLAHAYVNQVFQVRHQRQPRLDTQLGCQLRPGGHEAAGAPVIPLDPDQEAAFACAFNTVTLPFSWSALEPEEGNFRWQEYDQLVSWALGRGLNLVGGPLVDFSGPGLPPWLWEKDTNLANLCGLLADFVEKVVGHYHGSVRTWQVTAASNWAGVLATADDELLWLTVRLAEVVRQIDPTLEVVVGLAQPWGDYLSQQERNQSPFVFADNLVRTGLKVAALDLELIMAVTPRGNYCRDLLDVSRLLDLYALLGVPLQLTLGYPSAAGADPQADPDQKIAGGNWHGGFNPEIQADWADSFVQLGVSKPFVRGVHWAHFRDAGPHLHPHCGLIDAHGQAKPALTKLAAIRAKHLK